MPALKLVAIRGATAYLAPSTSYRVPLHTIAAFLGRLLERLVLGKMLPPAITGNVLPLLLG